MISKNSKAKQEVHFIDLFAGLGGTRLGFESACKQYKLKPLCLFSSEIKEHACVVYKKHFKENHIYGDITQINPSNIESFDVLLAGFPCQPFSSAGSKKGFMDKRGGLFFTICNILEEKKPNGFLLENVEGLVSHDKGRTLSIMISKLRDLGYHVNYRVLDSSEFSVPQKRRRLYLIGSLLKQPKFLKHSPSYKTVGSFVDYDYEFKISNFSKILTSKFNKEFLEGKSIKDKRGGSDNIHSWDLELKGAVNHRQKKLLSEILKKRRYKKWATLKGIDWMDGMPLTESEIRTFINYEELAEDLIYLTECGYLKFEYPKKLIELNGIKKRVYKTDAEKGYNIVSGKLSFPFSKILSPQGFVPTIVATEIGKIAVATEKGVRSITVREGLLFSGFPENYDMSDISYKESFDLIGNTVMPPVIEYVSKCLLEAIH